MRIAAVLGLILSWLLVHPSLAQVLPVDAHTILKFDFEGLARPDSMVIDRSPYGNNGVLRGANWSIADGVEGAAVRLTAGVPLGPTDYVYVPFDSSQLLADKFSIEIAFNPRGSGTQNPRLICGIVPNWAGEGMVISWDLYLRGTSSSRSVVFAYQTVTSTGIRVQDSITSIGQISNNNWYRLLVSLDGETSRIWINGILDREKPAAGSIFQDTTQIGITIGKINRYDASAGRNDYFDGDIDEIRLSSIARTPVISDMVAFYPFDGNADDATGNDYDGIVRGATLTPDRNGLPDNAYYFDGIDDIIVFPGLDWNTAASFTTALWFKYRSKNFGVMLEQGNGSSGTFCMNMAEEVSPQKVRVCVASTDGLWHGAEHPFYDTTQWHHLALVYDQSVGTFSQYLDGILTDSQLIDTVLDRSDTVSAGQGIGNTDPGWFNGSIDDISIYSRALTSSEIWSLNYYCANDPDCDSIPTASDNCPNVPNPSQQDSDIDGIGNACDACPLDSFNDIDGDGFCGNVDNCPTIANPTQSDADNDGLGDACDDLTVAFNAEPRYGNSPLIVQFTDQTIGSSTSWEWNFGDGTISNAQNPQHTYNRGTAKTSASSFSRNYRSIQYELMAKFETAGKLDTLSRRSSLSALRERVEEPLAKGIDCSPAATPPCSLYYYNDGTLYYRWLSVLDGNSVTHATRFTVEGGPRKLQEIKMMFWKTWRTPVCQGTVRLQTNLDIEC